MAKQVLDFDPVTGKTIWYDYEYGDRESQDQIIITETVDVEPVIEANKAAYNAGDHSNKHSPDGFRHAARIPLSVLHDLARQGIMTTGGRILDEPRLRKFLNDPDVRSFRVWPGRV